MIVVKMDNFHWQHLYIVLNGYTATSIDELNSLNKAFQAFEKTVIAFEQEREVMEKVQRVLREKPEAEKTREDQHEIDTIEQNKIGLAQRVVEVKYEQGIRDLTLKLLKHQLFQTKNHMGVKGLAGRREQVLAIGLFNSLQSAKSEFDQTSGPKVVSVEEVKEDLKNAKIDLEQAKK